MPSLRLSRNVASISPQTMRYRWVNPDALAGWSTSLTATTLQGVAAFAAGPPESLRRGEIDVVALSNFELLAC